jgi:NAD(P)-dependent dehydrogenase (short-subunit alcohol dehydrogenase family)
LAAAYLAKPNHTVIGSVRKPWGAQAAEVKNLPTASGSRLILVGIEATDFASPKKAIEEATAAGVDHIDIVIASSGVSIGGGPLESADPKAFTESFNINAVGPIALYQAARPLLVKSSAPKWVSISTRIASTAAALSFYPYAAAYGASKAALNWLTKYDLHAQETIITAACLTQLIGLSAWATHLLSHLRSTRGKLHNA